MSKIRAKVCKLKREREGGSWSPPDCQRGKQMCATYRRTKDARVRLCCDKLTGRAALAVCGGRAQGILCPVDSSLSFLPSARTLCHPMNSWPLTPVVSRLRQGVALNSRCRLAPADALLHRRVLNPLSPHPDCDSGGRMTSSGSELLKAVSGGLVLIPASTALQINYIGRKSSIVCFGGTTR